MRRADLDSDSANGTGRATPPVRLLAAIMAGLGVLAPRLAGAGNAYASYDLVQVLPYVGAEYTRIGFGAVTRGRSGLHFTGGDFSTTALTYGSVIGVRLAPISLGLLVQR